MTHELKLIGAAFPRTGAMSVKRALELLGLGRCYHMHEVFLHPDHVPVWDAACEGDIPDWPKLLAGYAATLDTPACHYWRELAQAFPDVKILLLERDPDAWYDSMYSTTYQVIYEVSQGWAPLCGFLGYDIPETPFPKKNTREEFRTRSRLP